ncbi:MAG: patatin-like phospholipase family protein [Gammaproteobacteria bacterium]|nr:patatin-like phospholipase family protein [Gammaproteobacteria bacterium]
MKHALNAFLLLALVTTMAPQSASAGPEGAPRVGLVLAGGGARGLAHIGVIKYLEENNIKVHAVAGTSMGSVVGGLYASGMSAAQVEEVARTLDWRFAFNDSTAREQQSFRRKQEDFDFLIGARLRFKDGKLGIPMGAIEGQHLNLLLHDLVRHVSAIDDFDKLPIPYRAVAADVVTGDAVVLDRGDLAVAMRASMSIPGVFAPIELDGHLLVDGGIAKNIPVDVVQGMGVDRLIVIDIGTPLAQREQLGNVLSLIGQLTTIMTRKNSEQQLALMREGDVLILPALDEAGVQTMSFDRVDDAIRLGYEAASALAPQLAAFASPGPAQQVAGITEPGPPRIDATRVETDANVSTELLRSRVTQPLGEPLDRERLERDIAEIYGFETFSRVDYQVQPTAAGNELVVRAIANPSGENYLKLGMSWDQDSQGTSEFGLRASWRQRGINDLGAEWFTYGQVGGNSNFGTEFHQPLDQLQHYFVEGRYRFDQRRLNLSRDARVLARALVDGHHVDLAPGINFGKVAQWRAGVYAGTANTDVEIGAPELSSRSDNDGGYFTELGYDSLDRPYFPGSGLRLLSRYAWSNGSLGASEDYEAWNTSAFGSFSLGRNSFTAIGRWAELDLDDTGNTVTGSDVFLSRAPTRWAASSRCRATPAIRWRGTTSASRVSPITAA